MGVPDWFLFTDSRETKPLHEGKCLQILLHFRGPHANKLEQDFSRLLRTGYLDGPSLDIPGYIHPASNRKKLPYRECGSKTKLEITRENILGSYGGAAGSLQIDRITLLVSSSLLILLRLRHVWHVWLHGYDVSRDIQSCWWDFFRKGWLTDKQKDGTILWHNLVSIAHQRSQEFNLGPRN